MPLTCCWAASGPPAAIGAAGRRAGRKGRAAAPRRLPVPSLLLVWGGPMAAGKRDGGRWPCARLAGSWRGGCCSPNPAAPGVRAASWPPFPACRQGKPSAWAAEGAQANQVAAELRWFGLRWQDEAVPPAQPCTGVSWHCPWGAVDSLHAAFSASGSCNQKSHGARAPVLQSQGQKPLPLLIPLWGVSYSPPCPSPWHWSCQVWLRLPSSSQHLPFLWPLFLMYKLCII